MLETVLRDHFTRYPALQIQDLYKLLHQAALGSEHAVSVPEKARDWLTRELAEMGESGSEPLTDPISHTGEIVRVHLRPFIAAGHNPNLLLEAFVRTANEYRGSVQLFEQYWQEAIATAKFPVQKVDEFFRAMKAKKFPAVHHSPEYEKLYHPAYRVVARVFCSETWLSSER